MGVTYNDYVLILKTYMIEIGITDADLKTYNHSLEENIHKEMYKRITGYYSNEPASIKRAINDNKNFLKRYINNIRV